MGRPKGSKNKIQKDKPNKIPSRNVGIQLGTSATSIDSAKTDSIVKLATVDVYNSYKVLYPELEWKRKLDRTDVPFHNVACQPDGGVIFYKNKIVLATEGKFQDKPTNAIERWHKNHNVLRMLNPEITYITFSNGLQAIKNGAIPKALDFMHLGEPNVSHPFYNSIFYNVDAFIYEKVYHIIESLLIATIEGINNNEAIVYVGRWKNKIDKTLSTIYA